jgi:hypothetical protein
MFRNDTMTKIPLKKATLGRDDDENAKPEKVYKRPIRNWQSLLRTKAVLKGKRGPSMRLLSSSQRREMRKRTKLKRLGKRK